MRHKVATIPSVLNGENVISSCLFLLLILLILPIINLKQARGSLSLFNTMPSRKLDVVYVILEQRVYNAQLCILSGISYTGCFTEHRPEFPCKNSKSCAEKSLTPYCLLL